MREISNPYDMDSRMERGGVDSLHGPIGRADLAEFGDTLKRKADMYHLAGILSVTMMLVTLGLAIGSLSIASESADQGVVLGKLLTSVAVSVQGSSDNIKKEVIPKTNLVLQSVSFSIPNEIRSATTNIIATVTRNCIEALTPGTGGGGGGGGGDPMCPIEEVHEHGIRVYSSDEYWTCPRNPMQFDPEVLSTQVFSDLIHSVPQMSHPGGCTSKVLLSVGDEGYAYTAISGKGGCQDDGKTSRIVQLGVIRSGPKGFVSPDKRIHLKEITTYVLPTVPGGSFRRKGCSILAYGKGAISICGSSAPGEEINDDLESPGAEGILIEILSRSGNITSHLYTTTELGLPSETTAVMGATGTGIRWRGGIYFVLLGGILGTFPGNVKCQSSGCPGAKNAECNAAYATSNIPGIMMVNWLMRIEEDQGFQKKPQVVVTPISPDISWIGAESSLTVIDDRAFIHIAEMGWQRFIQLGEITNDSPIRIRWIDNIVDQSSGMGRCPATNRCPRDCYTGMQAIPFPMSTDLKNYMRVAVLRPFSFESPGITAYTEQGYGWSFIVGSAKGLYGRMQTECFLWDNDAHCIHLIEEQEDMTSRASVQMYASFVYTTCNIPAGTRSRMDQRQE